MNNDERAKTIAQLLQVISGHAGHHMNCETCYRINFYELDVCRLRKEFRGDLRALEAEAKAALANATAESEGQ